MSSWRRRTELAALPLAALLAFVSCQPQPAQGPSQGYRTAAEQAQGEYAEAVLAGLAVYRVDPGSSHASILVRREGPLARFGHDHVIVARDIQGLVLWSPENPAATRADLWLDVRRLDVDPQAERQAFALDTSPDRDAIDGTRENLLEHVLIAERWPGAGLSVRLAAPPAPDLSLAAALELNGVTRPLAIPARVQATPDSLQASGRFTVKPSDWGIEPFSVLGGGLRVADAVEVHFQLEAARVGQPEK